MWLAVAGSAVIFVFFLAWAFAFLFSEFIRIQQTDSAYALSYVTRLTQSLLMMLGISMMTLIICRLQAARGDSTGGNPADAWKRWLRTHLKLLGLTLFIIGCTAHDLVGLLADGRCIKDIVTECHSTNVRAARALDIVQRLLRMVFSLTAVLFCYKFRYGPPKTCSLMLIGLSLTGTAAIASWISLQLDEAIKTMQPNTTSYHIGECFNETELASISEEVKKCIVKETDLYLSLATANVFTYPCLIEFLLLFIENIASLFFGSVDEQHDSADGGTDDTTQPLINSTDREETEQPTPTETREETEQPTSTETFGEVFCGISITCVRRYPCQLFFFLFGNMINAFLLILNALMYQYLDKTEVYRFAFITFRFIYWLLMIVIIVAGSALARSLLPGHPLSALPFKRLEYFFVVCSFGPIILSAMSVVASAGERHFILDAIANIVEVCAQTLYYFVARQVAVTELSQQSSEAVTVKRTIFRAILLWLACSNLTFWIEDSFFDAQNVEKDFRNKFFNSWPAIYNFFNPFTLMYRFNGILIFTELYLEISLEN